MSTLEVNKLTPLADNGTVTLGDSGDTITVPSGVTITNNGTQTGFGGTNTPNFDVRLSGNFGLTNDTFVKVTWDSETFDSDSAFASNKFTVPSGKAGKYFFVGKARMVNTTGYIMLEFYKNGSNAGIQFRSQSYSTTYESAIVTAILNLSVGDYIELYGMQVSGSANDLTSKLFQGYKLT